MKGLESDVFPVDIINYGRKEVQEAMQKEILKYKTFDAYEEVNDDGQDSIPIRWVVSNRKKTLKICIWCP